MIRFVSKLLLFPLQFLAFVSILFFGVLWLQTKSVDGDEFRSVLRDALGRMTGRAVHVGAVEVSFSWPPQVVITDLRIANRARGSRRPMLRVKRVVADLNPYHLVVGGRTVSRTVFLSPDILVERGLDGKLNWGSARGPAAVLAYAARKVGSGKVVISGGRLVVRDLRKGSVIVVPLGVVDVEALSSRIGPATAGRRSKGPRRTPTQRSGR
jgi:uncharacterized protein involved in outer membrane biogenesis